MAKQVRFTETGSASVMKIVELDVPAPAQSEVQISVQAIGINRAEIMYRKGEYVIEPVFPARLGYEASGEITRIGASVTEFSPGDRVAVIPAFAFSDYGMYGDLVNVPARAVVRIPDSQSWEEAAATWMMFTTAYGALVEFANITVGDTVLIRAASSSVGLAAIQIANMLGATPIALTRTSEKKAQLTEAGAAHVIATEEENLEEAVNRVTGGKGARIAFDPVGGPEAEKLIASLCHEGIYFLYGMLSDKPVTARPGDILGKHLTVRGYELFEITLDDQRLERAKTFINQGLIAGKLKPVIAKSFSFEEIQKAHDYMESNGQTGKIIVTVG